MIPSGFQHDLLDTGNENFHQYLCSEHLDHKVILRIHQNLHSQLVIGRLQQNLQGSRSDNRLQGLYR